MLYAIVAVIILILDQGLKYWTTVNLELAEGVRELIPGIVHLTNIHNNGAAFGMLSSVSFARWLFIIVTIAVVITVTVLVATKTIKSGFGRWMAVLVLAGAVGNCIDRILHGYVVDMFELEFISFPVFNVADIFITVGGILFCIAILCSSSEKEEVDEAADKAKAARLAAAKRSKGSSANIDEISKISVGGKSPAKAAPEASPAAKKLTVEQQREEYSRNLSRTYAHGAKAAAKKDDAFSEWEKPVPEEIPVFTPPVERTQQAAVKPEAVTKPDAAPVVNPVPAESSKTRVTVDEVEMEFSLEDILNEFK